MRTVSGNHVSILQLDDFSSVVALMLLEHLDEESRSSELFVVGRHSRRSPESIRKFFPDKKIIAYQSKQMMGSGDWKNVKLTIENLRGYDEVWDCDPLNAHFLSQNGVEVQRTFPFVYASCLEKIEFKDHPHIDVLFYGEVTDRRSRVIGGLQKNCPNLRMVWVLGDPDLDRYISDSKVILNIHAFEPWNRQEQARIFYPLINGKTVVSEPSQHDHFPGLVIQSDLKDMHSVLNSVCSSDLWSSFGKLAASEFKFKRNPTSQASVPNINKKKCAVFTIVRDESFYLPIWLNHYKKFFSNEDIYVMNNQSVDGSCDDLDVNVSEVFNDEAFSHDWLIDQVQKMQQKLLEKYEVVVFVEVDEILYCLDDLRVHLDEFRKSNFLYTNVRSGELTHDIDSEGVLDRNKTIMSQRSYWCRLPLNDKPLISKVPLKYGPGFHRCDKPPQFFGGFFMMHLHRIDFETMLERHQFRASRWKFADDGELGWHNKIADHEGVKKLLLDHPELVLVPEEHKKALGHL